MTVSMKRFLRPRCAERGATLTGYALLTAGLVVVSIGAIQGVNASSQTVLGETASSVGTPRPSVSDTKTAAVDAAPSWATPPGAGLCSPGHDGCKLGVKLTVNPDDYAPLSMGGDANWAGSADGVDLTTVHDDSLGQVYLESVVQVNGEWQPPQSDSDGSPGVTGVQPGDLVCTYLIHTSPAISPGQTKFHMDLEFGGPVLGTASNSNFAVDSVFASEGSTIPASNYLEGGTDEFEMSGNQLTVHDFYTDANAYDQVRVFVKC